MIDKEYIYYFDEERTLQRIPFEEVFKAWVIENGGEKEILENIRSMKSTELSTLPSEFIRFFSYKYGFKIFDDDKIVCQDHLHEIDFYKSYLNRLKSGYENRYGSPRELLLFFIVIVTIILIVLTL